MKLMKHKQRYERNTILRVVFCNVLPGVEVWLDSGLKSFLQSRSFSSEKVYVSLPGLDLM